MDLRFTSKDADNLYFVLEPLLGGPLHKHTRAGPGGHLEVSKKEASALAYLHVHHNPSMDRYCIVLQKWKHVLNCVWCLGQRALRRATSKDFAGLSIHTPEDLILFAMYFSCVCKNCSKLHGVLRGACKPKTTSKKFSFFVQSTAEDVPCPQAISAMIDRCGLSYGGPSTSAFVQRSNLKRE